MCLDDLHSIQHIQLIDLALLLRAVSVARVIQGEFTEEECGRLKELGKKLDEIIKEVSHVTEDTA